MEEMFFVRRKGPRRCLWIVVSVVVTVVLIYYIVERRLNVTVADYYLPKKKLKTNDQNPELEIIKMKEEDRILNAGFDPNLHENGERQRADDPQPSVKEFPIYMKVKKASLLITQSVWQRNTRKSRRTFLQPSNVTRNNILWVYSDGAITLENRIVNYLRKIESLRTSILSSRTQQNWTDVHDSIDVLWCNQDDFLRSLQKYDHVRTIAFVLASMED